MRKRLAFAKNSKIENLFDFCLKFAAKHSLALTGNRQVDIRHRTVIKRITQKRSFAHATTSRDDNKLRLIGRKIPPSAEHFHFFAPTKELHQPSPFENDRFENSRFENRGIISYLRRGVNAEALRALGAGLARTVACGTPPA
jgi:hypothetical protein